MIDIPTRHVTQVQLKSTSPPGLHAMPEGVAVIGHQAYLTDEGDGTIATFDIDDPGSVSIYTPQPANVDPVPIDPTKTHPFQIAVRTGTRPSCTASDGGRWPNRGEALSRPSSPYTHP